MCWTDYDPSSKCGQLALTPSKAPLNTYHLMELLTAPRVSPWDQKSETLFWVSGGTAPRS